MRSPMLSLVVGAITDQLSMVRQILRGLDGRWYLLLFQEQGTVLDDAVRHWRVLLRKPLPSPLGAAQCAAASTSPPAYMTATATPSRTVRPRSCSPVSTMSGAPRATCQRAPAARCQ
jgi:hypothetical protein